MEESPTQKPLSKKEILAEFANTPFDPHYVDFFYDSYLDEFEVWEDYDNPNEMALKCVNNGFVWYALYKQIGPRTMVQGCLLVWLLRSSD